MVFAAPVRIGPDGQARAGAATLLLGSGDRALGDADLFLAWKGSVFVGALRGMMLDRLTMAETKVADGEPLLVELRARIRDVRVGPELRRLVAGVSEKMLIQPLRELRADAIIERLDFKEIPPKVEYSLTPVGRTLAEALQPLCEWGSAHSADIEAISRRRLAAQAGDAPLSSLSIPIGYLAGRIDG